MVVGMILGMVGSSALVGRLGRHLLHIGILLIAAGALGLASILTGARSASSWDLVPGLFFIGAGVGASIGQLFRFILTSVTMDEVGSASGVMEAVQQLSTALGVAVLGTIFFATFAHHLPTDALRVHRTGLPGTARSRLRPCVPECPCTRRENRLTRASRPSRTA
jgi:predicted MFS family arabinose efflux permease